MQELQKNFFEDGINKKSAQKIFQSFDLCLASNKETKCF